MTTPHEDEHATRTKSGRRADHEDDASDAHDQRDMPDEQARANMTMSMAMNTATSMGTTTITGTIMRMATRTNRCRSSSAK